MKKTMVAFTIALALNTQAGIVYWNAPNVDFRAGLSEDKVVMLFVVQTPVGGQYHEINALLDDTAFTGEKGGLILDAVTVPSSGYVTGVQWFDSDAFVDGEKYNFDLFVFVYYPLNNGSGAFYGDWHLDSEGLLFEAGGTPGIFDIHPNFKDEWGAGLYYNIPEPTTGLLALCGAAALFLRRRKRT